MPASEFAVGGAFKFKGAKDAGIDKKRKKKKKKDEPSANEKANEPDTQNKDQAHSDDGGDDVSAKLTAPRPPSLPAPTKTKAELEFERRRRDRLLQQSRKDGSTTTHKDRVREFNEKLARQSDHHDMPRIGPG